MQRIAVTQLLREMVGNVAPRITHTAPVPMSYIRRMDSSDGPIDDGELLRILEACSVTKETLTRRKLLQKRLAFALRRRYGPQFIVSDVGMHQWIWNWELEGVPPEFAILDISYLAQTDWRSARKRYGRIYDPVDVATTLAEAGFTHITPRTSHYINDGPNLPGHVVASGGEPFTLSMPGPTVWRTVELLREYMKLNHRVPQLIAFLWIWARSHDLHRVFSPRILSLMAISILQKRGGLLRSLQGPEMPFLRDDSLKPDHRWVHGTGPNPIMYQVDTGFLEAQKLPGRLGPLVKPFFEYLAQDHTYYPPALSIRSNPKDPKYFRMPDPFIYTNNLTASIDTTSKTRFSELRYQAYDTLRLGGSLYDILGPHLPIHLTNRDTDTVTIDTEIRSLYTASRPSADVKTRRDTIIGKVQSIIRCYIPKATSYKVRPFGSTVIGLSTDKSDLDLLVMVPPSKQLTGTSELRFRKGPIYNVNYLAHILQRNGFTQIETRPTASVPIVKFRDPVTELSCDLSVGETLGLRNTYLIKAYCDLLPILRPFLFAIKLWAKPLGLNTPSGAGPGGASFSSYALTLMTIGLFQSKGWLPNMQENVPPDQYTYHWFKSKPHYVRCRAGFVKPYDWEIKKVSIEEALLAWFKYWGEEFQYKEDLVSIRHGGIIPRPQPLPETPEVEKDREDFLDTEGPQTDTSEEEPYGLKKPVLDIQTGELEEAIEPDNELHSSDELDLPVPQKSELMEASPYSMPTEWRDYPIIVIDPFIHVKNTASMVAIGKQRQFRRECSIAYSMLKEGRSWASILQYAKFSEKQGPHDISLNVSRTPAITRKNAAGAATRTPAWKFQSEMTKWLP